MSPLHLIILSIIEGLTEFLPISSTAHMIMAAKLLNIPSTQLRDTFEIAIQLGAVLAVSLQYLKQILTNPNLIIKIIIAFIPTAIIGFIADQVLGNTLLNNPLLTGIMLFLGGIYMITWDKASYLNNGNKQINDLTIKDALFIGALQSLAIIPGVSRAAATIFAGQIRKANRQAALEFSFLLALPTIAAASLYSLIKIPLHELSQYTSTLSIGSLIAFITAFITVNFFLKNTRWKWQYFSIYRIIIGLIFILLILQ